MLLNYADLLTHLENIIKIRAANYVSLDCDIETLLYTVYEDIQQSVLIDEYKQEHVITENETTIYLRNNNAPVMGNAYDEAKVTERYTDVLDIVDKYDLSISKKLHKTNVDTWRWNEYAPGKLDTYCIEYEVGDSIYFIRKKILEVKYLTPDIYNRLLTALTEGIMYYIETAIPSEIDTQVGNLSYQRFDKAKTDLRNRSSQISSSPRRYTW